MKKNLYQLLLPLLLLASWGARAQTRTVIQKESFENALGSTASQVDQTGANTLVLTTTASGSAEQYFLRTSNATVATDAPGFQSTTTTLPTNVDGTFYWAGEGVKGADGYVVSPPTRIGGRVTLKSVSVTGYADLKVTIALFLCRASRTNDRMEQDDTLRVQVRFNGTGNWTTVGQLVGDRTSGTGDMYASGRWRVDAGKDGMSADDVAAGTPTVGNPFSDFTFSVPGSGSTMQTRIVVAEQGGSEEFAFDNIRVSGVASTNQAPVLGDPESTALAYAEGQGPVNITNIITVSDADNATLQGATVRFTAGFDNTEDQLLFSPQNGISIASNNATTGVLTLTGSATLAAYQTALRAVQYKDMDGTDASPGTRTLAFTVTDGVTSSLDVFRSITVTPALDAAGGMPYAEDLESNGEGTRYTSNDGTMSTGYAFVRTNAPSEPNGQWHQNGFSAVTISGINNNYYWWASGTAYFSGGTGTFVTKQTNTSGYTNLNFSVKLAASNNVWELNGLVKVYYRLNGGSWVPLISFRSTDQTATVAYNSTTGNLARDASPTTTTGVPTGAQLTPALTTYTAALPAAANGQLVDFRIDATSVSGDRVGEVIGFDNLQLTGTPALTVTTAAATSVTATSAVLGGNVTEQSGGSVTGRGVVYSTSATVPAAIGGAGVSQVANGTGTGAFSGTVSGLTPVTTYYVRAYATNSSGTAYGSVASFTTPTPTITLTPTTLPDGALGTAYSQTITAAGGTGPYTFSLTRGSLPPGLTLSSAGVLSGSPTTAGTFGPILLATDANGYRGSQAYNLTIAAATTVASVTRLTPSPTATAQVSYQVVFAASVTGVTAGNFSVTPLTGTITGASVSSVSGSGTTYTVVVNTGSGDGTLRLDVANSAGITPTVSNTPYTAGETYTITKRFTTPVLTVQGTRAGPGVDVTAFVDQVRLVTNGTTTTVNGAVANASFETHGALSNGNYGYTPTATPWTFNTASGIATNGSAFGIGTAPDGVAVAFVQSGATNGLLQQSLAAPAGTYQVRFLTAQRNTGPSNQLLNVFIKQGAGGPDVFVGSIQPGVGSYTPEFVSSAFTVTATAPTDIVLSANTVTENAAPSTAVGTLSGISATPGETYTYTLVSGAGATDNASFRVAGTTLRTAALFNFEAQNSYSLRVRATSTSDASLTFEKVFTVRVTDVNEAPTTPIDVNPAANTVAENAANGTAVGLTASATDPDAGATLTYSLTDNAGGRFAINATTGVVTVANGVLLNFESAASHTITVQASDGTLTASQSFAITVTNVNETPQTPTDANAAANTVAENAAAGTSVGITASATDPDTGATLTYSLTDNAGGRFTINATTGVVTVADGTLLNFEAATSHTITVQASDGALASSQSFTIQVSNVNEAPLAPTDTNAAANTVAENAAGGTSVRITASALDPDAGTTLTYALTDNAGGRFVINSSTGVVTVANGALLDFEAATAHAITVQVSDGALTASQSFTIQVTDVDDTAPAAPVVATPANGSLTADASPAVTGMGEAGSTIRVYVNNVLQATTTATGTGTWSATLAVPLADGVYSVRATATDAAGNTSPDSSPNTFTVDTTAPNTVLTATPADPSNSASASFRFTGTDGAGSGVASFEANLDGGGFTAATSPQTYIGLSDGAHTLEVRAIDAAGNVDPTPARYTWLIDTQQPMVSISSTAGANGSRTGTSPIPFTVTFSENVTGFGAGAVSVNNGTLSDFSGSGTTYTFNVTPITDGEVTVNLPANVAQDVAGNGNTATTPYSITYAPVPVDLVVSTGTADNPEPIAAGTYRSITVTADGYAQLSGAVGTTQSVLVQGGLLTNCQSLTGDGTFTLSAGATLGICDAQGLSSAPGTGAVQTTGTRDFSTDALYVYTGTEAQVTGDALPATVRELVVNSLQGLTLTQRVRIRQRVILNEATLLLNDEALTLLSDANGTALVVNNGGRIVGETGTMQRYIGTNTGQNGYRHYSSPVQAETFRTLAAGSYTPDFSGAAAYNSSATPGLVTPFPTVFAYNQDRIPTSPSTYTNFDKGFEAPTSGDELVEVGRGYAVQAPGNILVDFTGQFTSDVVTRSGLRRSQNAQGTDVGMGWHLLGNPYPSPLNWNTMSIGSGEGDNLQGLNAAVYVVQSSGPYTGTYRTYLAQAPNDETSSPIIPAGQGFFVRTTTAGTPGTLRLTNQNRVTDFNVPQPSFGRGTADERPLVRLSVRNGAGTSTDRVTLYADAKATAGVDAAYDATKLSNPSGLNLSAVAATGETLAIDGRPAFASGTVIALRLSVPTAGTYVLSAMSVAHLPAGLVAYLRDAATGQQVNLSQQPTTTVTLSAGLSTRYAVVFATSGALASTPVLTAAQVALYPNPASQSASVQVALPVAVGTRVARATVLNSLGQVMSQTALTVQAGQASGTLSTTGLASGVYVVRLQAGTELVSKRLVVE